LKNFLTPGTSLPDLFEKISKMEKIHDFEAQLLSWKDVYNENRGFLEKFEGAREVAENLTKFAASKALEQMIESTNYHCRGFSPPHRLF